VITHAHRPQRHREDTSHNRRGLDHHRCARPPISKSSSLSHPSSLGLLLFNLT
ncbi:uncharacterized protein STEHIDRAFT_173267, partial [Stereum hirsutum FP-91666 SS1]